MKSETRNDLYARITAAVIEELENGTRPWAKQWVSTTPRCRPRRFTGLHYRGINTLLLWAASAKRGFESPFWMTYRQASEIGGQVRRGEKGTAIVFFTTLPVEKSEDTPEEQGKVPFLRTYSVFNASQIEKLPERFNPEVAAPTVASFDNARIDSVDCFFRKAGVEVEHGGDIPHYSPAYDRVQMPPLSAFRSAEDYYAILAHEAIHWTGHPSRLPRRFPGKNRGQRNYAREELIAELGAAFLCADLGITHEPRPDHSDYIKIWLEVLRSDKRAIFHAACVAEKATEYLHLLQAPERESPPNSVTWPQKAVGHRASSS